MAEHLKTGKDGEEFSIDFLKKLGYTILETNWRYKHLEIDIIALDNELLVAIEVKTRSTDAFGQPEVFVDKTKQKKLIKGINEYVNKYGLEYEIRFDIVSVLINNGAAKISHIKDAFYPSISSK